jgi:serine/threonine protein phosphatase PrpC
MHTDPLLSNTTPHRPCCGPRLEIAIRSFCSPTGQGREENQDNFLLIDGRGHARFLWHEQETQRQLTGWPHGHRRLAVLDGMGGHCYGREAAERAVEGLLELPAMTDLAQLSNELTLLHQRLYQEFQLAGMETGCTLIVLEIPQDSPTLLFHVGDSRAYSVDAHSAQCLTVDHVPATHLALLGLLDSTQWLQQVHIETSSQISQAFILGSTLGAANFYVDKIDQDLYELHDGNLPPFLRGLSDRRALTLEADRVYLLASDGLWHLRYPQTFIQRWPVLLSQPHRSLEELLDELLAELAIAIRQQQRQPDDNCTVILVRKLTQAEDSSHPS